MDEAFDALLDLDEGAVVLERNHLATHHGSRRVLGLGVGPRIFHHLLEAERHALSLGVELEHLHADMVTNLEQLRWMSHAAPRHVRDVQQAVDAAEVDKGAVLSEVLDNTLDDLAFLE